MLPAKGVFLTMPSTHPHPRLNNRGNFFSKDKSGTGTAAWGVVGSLSLGVFQSCVDVAFGDIAWHRPSSFLQPWDVPPVLMLHRAAGWDRARRSEGHQGDRKGQ